VAFPLTGQYTHYSLTKDGKPSYVTDSAASGSAWATGTKTYNGAISVDIAGHDQKTLLQLAKEAGKATGDISTAEVQDATPAVQVAKAGDHQGTTLEVQAKERGFHIVRTADELAATTAASQDAPLLGLFADGNMPITRTAARSSSR